MDGATAKVKMLTAFRTYDMGCPPSACAPTTVRRHRALCRFAVREPRSEKPQGRPRRPTFRTRIKFFTVVRKRREEWPRILSFRYQRKTMPSCALGGPRGASLSERVACWRAGHFTLAVTGVPAGIAHRPPWAWDPVLRPLLRPADRGWPERQRLPS
jgi:hypothetical protein